ncbi:hypothetical protein MNV49_006721 [Pseudohyphozyma bogoriensis]|nr:hypothetical protein MNV49_006721 [Pseudohyphozyma bogoriensis]
MSLAPSTLRRLMRELSQLASNPPEGIALSKESMASLSGEEIDGYGTDLSNIRAWVAGPPGTPFEGGYFKIRFSFGDDFPAAPPKSSASAPTSTKSSGATPLGDSNSNAANSMERSGSTGSLSGSPKKRSVGEVVGEGVGTVSKVAAGGAPAAKKVEKAPVKKRGLKRL